MTENLKQEDALTLENNLDEYKCEDEVIIIENMKQDEVLTIENSSSDSDASSTAEDNTIEVLDLEDETDVEIIIVQDVKSEGFAKAGSSPQYLDEVDYSVKEEYANGLDMEGEAEENFETEEKFEQEDTDAEGPFMCDTCGGVFELQAEFEKHKLIHSDAINTMCEISEDVIKNSSTQLNDIPSFSDVLPFMCELCGNRFKNESALESHEIIHMVTYDYICNCCASAFNSITNLKMHQKKCHRDSCYICDCCNRRFNFKADIEAHFKRKDTSKMEQMKYTCPTCNLKFMNLSKWIAHHYNTHKGGIRGTAQDLEVQINGMKFEYLVLLNSDHTIGTYKCKVCKMSFSKYPRLYQHYTKHWEQRPYTCALCNRGFYYRTTLKRHLLVHEKKPFICEMCDASFKTTDEKDQHTSLVHSSKRAPPVDTHWRTALEATLHKCDICGNIFTTKDSRDQHIIRAHKKKTIKRCVITLV